METKVTVIIPIYNSQDSLRECVFSVLNQTFQDFEILLINDGSTDDSLKICKELELLDNRIRVFTKENGGVSSARNVGIDNAIGEWLAMLDADDQFASTRLENLYRFASSNDFNLVFDNMKGLNKSGGEYWPSWRDRSKELHINEMLRSCTGLTRKTYSILKPFVRRNYLFENQLRYNEVLRQSEDFEFYIKIMLRAKVAGRVANVGYFYNEPDYKKTESSLLKNASMLYVEHRLKATELIVQNGIEYLSICSRLWLLIRLKNMKTSDKVLRLKALRLERDYLSSFTFMIRNPWLVFRKLIRIYVRLVE